jgi:cytochrome P450
MRTALAAHDDVLRQAIETHQGRFVKHTGDGACATFRTAAVDIELGGVTIPAGALTIVNAAAANRDPAVYDDPGRLDIIRDAPAAMATFGGGVHYCLGSHLARAELVEA